MKKQIGSIEQAKYPTFAQQDRKNTRSKNDDLVNSGVADTKEPVLPWIELRKLELQKGVFVGLSGGGKYPLKITFNVVTPYWNQEKEEKKIATQQHAKIREIYQPLLRDKKLVNGRGIILDNLKRKKITYLLKIMPIGSDQVFGSRMGVYDFAEKKRIEAGYYPLPLSSYQEAITLLENGTYNSAAVSISAYGYNKVSIFSIYLHPQKPSFFYA